MRCDLRTDVVTASPDRLFWPGRRLLQTRVCHGLGRTRKGTAAAARAVVGSLRGRYGTENYEPLSSLQVRVIARFHQQQAKEAAKWLNLGPGLGETASLVARYFLQRRAPI